MKPKIYEIPAWTISEIFHAAKICAFIGIVIAGGLVILAAEWISGGGE